MALLTGGNIANIERVQIATKDTQPKTYVFETASNATFNASVEQGTEVTQRVKNAIMGLIRTEDLVKGYDIELEDQRLIMEIFALIDGGTVTNKTGGGDWEKYASPAAGSPVTRTEFDMTLYTSDRDSDGGAIEYYAWKFASCKGSPVSGGAKDDDFTTMKYTIKSRPAKGVSALELTRAESLPEVT